MLLPEAGAILHRGSWLRRLPAHGRVAPSGAFFVRVPSRTSMLIASIRRRRIVLDQASVAKEKSPWTASTPVRITGTSAAIPLQDHRSGIDAGRQSSANNFSLPAATICARTKAAGRWNSSASGSSSIFGSSSSMTAPSAERGEDARSDQPSRVYVLRHRQAEALAPLARTRIPATSRFENMPMTATRVAGGRRSISIG